MTAAVASALAVVSTVAPVSALASAAVALCMHGNGTLAGREALPKVGFPVRLKICVLARLLYTPERRQAPGTR